MIENIVLAASVAYGAFVVWALSWPTPTPASTPPGPTPTKPRTDRERWNDFLDGVAEGLHHIEQRERGNGHD